MLVDRTKKARRGSTCPACRTGITVGQPIARVANQWMHTTCAIRGDTRAAVTVAEMTEDLTDKQVATIAATEDFTGRSLLEVREAIAVARVAAPMWESGAWTKHEAMRLAAASLGITTRKETP